MCSVSQDLSRCVVFILGGIGTSFTRFLRYTTKYFQHNSMFDELQAVLWIFWSTIWNLYSCPDREAEAMLPVAASLGVGNGHHHLYHKNILIRVNSNPKLSDRKFIVSSLITTVTPTMIQTDQINVYYII